MCGIAGIVNLDGGRADKEVLLSMSEVQRHRGPDDFGIYMEKFVGLSHVRLAVIDLSQEAHQPMPNEDSSIYIIHNGEIYN